MPDLAGVNVEAADPRCIEVGKMYGDQALLDGSVPGCVQQCPVDGACSGEECAMEQRSLHLERQLRCLSCQSQR